MNRLVVLILCLIALLLLYYADPNRPLIKKLPRGESFYAIMPTLELQNVSAVEAVEETVKSLRKTIPVEEIGAGVTVKHLAESTSRKKASFKFIEGPIYIALELIADKFELKYEYGGGRLIITDPKWKEEKEEPNLRNNPFNE